MERKRAESDIFNIQEFCHRLPYNESESSCARTESVLERRKDSKSHLKGTVHAFRSSFLTRAGLLEPHGFSIQVC